MKKLIINADDFALTNSVNRGIIKAFAKGALSGASILTTAGDLKGAADLALLAKLPLGLHLCLTYGQPAAPLDKVKSLVDGRGFFKKLDCLKQNPPPAEEVATEWRAQLAKLQAAGITPDHLDSHHYAHEILGPDIAAIALDLAKELGVPLRHTVAENKAYYRQRGVKTPDGFCGEFYGEGASSRQMLEILDRPWDGALELMCHPGEPDGAIEEISSYSRGRQRELDVLLSGGVREKIRGIGLISFADI